MRAWHRKQLGWKQRQIAVALGVREVTVKRFVSRRSGFLGDRSHPKPELSVQKLRRRGHGSSTADPCTPLGDDPTRGPSRCLGPRRLPRAADRRPGGGERGPAPPAGPGRAPTAEHPPARQTPLPSPRPTPGPAHRPPPQGPSPAPGMLSPSAHPEIGLQGRLRPPAGWRTDAFHAFEERRLRQPG